MQALKMTEVVVVVVLVAIDVINVENLGITNVSRCVTVTVGEKEVMLR